jgi:hypothetical protein
MHEESIGFNLGRIANTLNGKLKNIYPNLNRFLHFYGQMRVDFIQILSSMPVER